MLSTNSLPLFPVANLVRQGKNLLRMNFKYISRTGGILQTVSTHLKIGITVLTLSYQNSLPNGALYSMALFFLTLTKVFVFLGSTRGINNNVYHPTLVVTLLQLRYLLNYLTILLRALAASSS